MGYGSLIVQEFPQELQLAMLRFAETLEQSLRSQLAVRREDFDELRQELAAFQQRTDIRFDRVEQALVDLATAQQRTEQRVEELATAQQRTEQRVEELATAQQRTEQRLAELAERTDQRFAELAAAQQRTEQRLAELAERTDQRFAELAAAQQRSEERIAELVIFQQRTEQRLSRVEDAIEQLTVAQQRTERELASLAATVEKLTDALDDTRKQLGGLSMTVGYTFENEAYKALPALLQRDYGLTVEGRLTRGYVHDNKGAPLEVNILGTARQNGHELTIIGESKVQLSKNDIDRFLRRQVDQLTGVYPRIFPLLVTHMISEPDAEAYAQEKAVALYYSYDF
jgi:DNA repair exonuclease SbcCD ATPase subunit